MRAAFFHDHVFERDSRGVFHSRGNLPYRVLARYAEHFDKVVVVGRVRAADPQRPSVAEGPGVEMACLDGMQRWSLLLACGLPRRHVRNVLAEVDCAIIRMPSAIGRIACEEALRTGTPWLVEVVGCAWDALWNHGSIAGKVLAPRSFALMRRYIAMAPFALYVTQHFLQRRYPCGGESLGCSDAAVDRAPQGVLARRLSAIDSTRDRGRWTLGIVGSLNVDYKGHDTALEALRLLTRAGLDVRLRCLGAGDHSRWRARARALGVSDRVEFTGTLPHGPAVFDWMDALDVFLIPSLQEGLPRALVEAMSRGLPAVGARTGGIPELIGPEYIHPRRDPRGMARIVERLTVGRDEVHRCARRNFEAARAFSADVLDPPRRRFLERFRRFAESRSGERVRVPRFGR
jgi:hypothetical protein